MSTTATPKFTLRFRDPKNSEILGLLAQRYGVSKNRLAEDMLARELQAEALLLEHDLTGTIDLLRRYRKDEHLAEAIAEFAHAEAYEDDPIKTRMVTSSQTADAYGIAKAFA